MSNVSKYFSQDSIRHRSFSLDFYLKCQVSQNVKFFQIISPRIQFDSAHLVQNFQNYSHSLRFPLKSKLHNHHVLNLPKSFVLSCTVSHVYLEFLLVFCCFFCCFIASSICMFVFVDQKKKKKIYKCQK